eukprot:scaffold504462_cov17-Prasinocladus_malaysianus.AAC.1
MNTSTLRRTDTFCTNSATVISYGTRVYNDFYAGSMRYGTVESATVLCRARVFFLPTHELATRTRTSSH